MNLNNLRDKAFAIATSKGFHDKEYSNEHWLMLVITELSEAVEADRKGKRADKDAMIDTIDAGGFSNGFFEDYIKGTVEEELADAVIRLLDLAGLRGKDVEIDEDTILEVSKEFEQYSFTESIMIVTSVIMEGVTRFDIKDSVRCMLGTILALAKHNNIDLLWHINQKMNYNENREPLHGKDY